jgi:hypothetical protein
MVSASWLQRSLIGAAACIVASGCSDDSNNNDLLRVPNKPPVIVKDSLRWAPGDPQIITKSEYEFSVTANDPDIGDSIDKFYWRFFDNAGNLLDVVKETSVPRLKYTFNQQIPESDSMFFYLSVYAVDKKGAAGEVEIFALPMASGQMSAAVETINHKPNTD